MEEGRPLQRFCRRRKSKQFLGGFSFELLLSLPWKGNLHILLTLFYVLDPEISMQAVNSLSISTSRF